MTGRASQRASARASWTGVAFIVEAMLLLLFLVASLALFTSLFASAVQRGAESRDLTTAVAVATDTAERFAADPSSIPERMEKSGMMVVCEVDDEERGAGVLHNAVITVYGPDAEAVYSLKTACYESGVA